jgi:molybdenum cofactor synthesis domain-containing protein
MNAEIIAIGTELLLGQIVDTNSAFIAKRLAENGIEMVQTKTVGDDLKRIEESIQDSIHRSSIVITTGGIGPTEDDLTREAIANVSKRPLTFQPALMEQIEAIFKRRGFGWQRTIEDRPIFLKERSRLKTLKDCSWIYCGRSAWVTVTLPGVPLRWSTY